MLRQFLADLFSTKPRRSPFGHIDGRHHTEYSDEHTRLRHAGQDEESLALILRMIDATEAESKRSGEYVVAWYYEAAAVACRKLKRYDDEVRVIQRYLSVRHNPEHGKTDGLKKRLPRAIEMRDGKR